ncbi:hypothetical protein Tco_1479140, partial [Tanacetum coccineum]
MSSASSAVTYTSVYTDSEPGRVFWGADEELSDGGSPRVIIYGYDGLPMQPVAPPSPDYMPGPKHPPSPDYVPGPKHPPSPVEVSYVSELEYPEYLVPSDVEAPLEDQPLPTDASPTALSPGYMADSDPDEDPKEDPKEDHADYPADGGMGMTSPLMMMMMMMMMMMILMMRRGGDTEAFETDESAPTPRPPQTIVPFAQTRLYRARKTVRLEPRMSASIETRIAEHADAPTPPLPITSPLLPLPSPLTTSLTDAGAPLGYRAAGIQMRAAAVSPPLLLPSTSHRTDVPEAEMPPQKRAFFATPAPELEIGESSAAGAARQPRPTPEADTWDEIVEAMIEVRFEEARDNRAFLRARVNTLFRNRQYHHHTAMALDRESVYARIAWTGSEDMSAAIEAHVRT